MSSTLFLHFPSLLGTFTSMPPYSLRELEDAEGQNLAEQILPLGIVTSLLR